ncbi:hypothetical protein D3C80_1623070 [compost metagenome]
MFTLRIEGAGGFIEQQDRRVHQQRPGDGQALALTTGEAQPAVAQMGLVTVGHLLNEVVGVGNLRRLPDLLQRRRGFTIANVLFDAAEKQRRGL